MTATVVAAALCLAFLAWLWRRWESRYRYWVEKGKRSRRAEFDEWIRFRRIGAAALAVVVVAAAIWTGVVLSRPSQEEQQSEIAEGPPAAASTPTPGTAYPIVFETASRSGAVVADITNATKRRALIECFLDAFDEGGDSILTGTYAAVDELGNAFESRVYAARVELDPGATQRIEVNLQIDGRADRITGECFRIPFPKTPGPTVVPTG